MSKTELRKFLASRSSQQLTEEILILYDRLPAVREYLEARLEIDSSAKSFAKYVRQIDQEFYTCARNPTGRPSKGRQILRAYKQVAASHEDIVGLTLYYVSAVLRFMRIFGIQEDAYFKTVESAFREAAEVTVAHDLVNQLAGAFEEVIDAATNTSEHLACALRELANRYALSLA